MEQKMEFRDKNGRYIPVFSWCSAPLDATTYTRRCFMTGEYCSKQENIQKERQLLHKPKTTINAFVVMSFSNVSDVVYKWRIRSFVETLKKYLFVGKKTNSLYCIYCQPACSSFLDSSISQSDIDEVREILNENGYCIGEDDLDQNDVLKLLVYPPIPLKAAVEISKREAESEACNIEELVGLLRQLSSSPASEGPLSYIEKINVLRADSDLSTNFVICNRVCQQLQIADLIVVDVSVTNANVFYELGMSVALGKMILPICYSDTYYKRDVISNCEGKKLHEHHIGNYRWRKELFEHFGIRYRNNSEKYTKRIETLRRENKLVAIKEGKDWITQYEDFDTVTETCCFDDSKYKQFPYLENIVKQENEENRNTEGTKYNFIIEAIDEKSSPHIPPEDGYLSIGELIYKKLQNSYNLSSGFENTLVVYTMDGFLNEDQAALCIVNYYNAIVRQFEELHCFCGERVGVLLEGEEIKDDPKDGELSPHYSVGDIIQIGVNQATYKAHIDLVKPNNFLTSVLSNKKIETTTHTTEEQLRSWKEGVEQATKEFIRNRAIPIYPKNPIYVKRIKDGLQPDLLKGITMRSACYGEKPDASGLFFSFYHVMLRTLKYTNELVVDIGTNSVQSLFWLGAAHGSDTSAISVRHEKSFQEKQQSSEEERKQRFIFDVAGLWSAQYRSDDADGFYEQLARAQSGIEQYSKLILKDRDILTSSIIEDFWSPKQDQIDQIVAKHNKKETLEDKLLESYYRNRFWRPMLRYNKLNIYLRQEAMDSSKTCSDYMEMRPNVLRWDVDAVGMISNYLSRRKTIGEYQIKTLEQQKPDSDKSAISDNFICIGSEAGPVLRVGDTGNDEVSVPKILKQKYGDDYRILCREVSPSRYPCTNNGSLQGTAIFKGFYSFDKCPKIMTQIPTRSCYDCLQNWIAEKGSPVFIEPKQVLFSLPPDNNECLLKVNACSSDLTSDLSDSLYHVELAQLILWRDSPAIRVDEIIGKKSDYFRVAISGSSGPATKALASLFVDDPLKGYSLMQEDNQTPVGSASEERITDTVKRSFPLYSLQDNLRKDFIQHYCRELEAELDDILNQGGDSPIVKEAKKLYEHQVIYSAEFYLSTVLYRYFLPFLSTEDIMRISNGMRMYISNFRAVKRSPFAHDYPINAFDSYGYIVPNNLVDKCADAVVKIIEKSLSSLTGAIAYYRVEVKVDIKEQNNRPGEDVRQIVGLVQLEEGVNKRPDEDVNEKNISYCPSCLFSKQDHS